MATRSLCMEVGRTWCHGQRPWGAPDKGETGHRVEDSEKAPARGGHGDVWVGLWGDSAQAPHSNGRCR